MPYVSQERLCMIAMTSLLNLEDPYNLFLVLYVCMFFLFVTESKIQGNREESQIFKVLEENIYWLFLSSFLLHFSVYTFY